VVLRLRIENRDQTPLVLAGSEFQLLDAGLVPFDAARVEDWPERLEPGAVGTIVLRFGVPPGRAIGDYDLGALHLSASLQNGRWTWSTTFEQAPWRDPYHDPHRGPSWHIGFGAVWRC
jgi:hypothetical protein